MGLNKRLIDQAGGAAGGASTDNFDISLFTGNGSTQSITSLDFQPDFVWIKKRSGGTARDNMVYDSIRGAGYRIRTNQTYAESYASNELTSFDSNGFSLGDDDAVNGSTYPYVAWCLKAGGTAVSNTDGSITSSVSANPDAGFSIVKYTGGTGVAETGGHGLSSAPEMIILKRTDAAENWLVYTSVIDGSWDFLKLNLTDAKGDSSANLPTNSVFSIGGNSGDFIAYCFHSVDGYQKLGTYTATGSAGSPTVTTGFQPRFLMVKNIDKNQEWIIVDSARNNGANSLRPDSSAAENTAGDNAITLGSTGFTIAVSGSGVNYQAGDTFIYLAIA